ncbi:MAG: hypothetical protein U0869_16425 [Chloroflexota bacterium]
MRAPRHPRRAARPRRLASILLAAGAALSAGAFAIPATPVAAQESLLAQVYPEAATLGLPDGIGLGSELTWYVAGASVAQSRYQWVEDPNGTWEDPKTGKKYRRTDESGEGDGSGAGDGYAVVDVVAVEGPDVVTNVTLLGMDHLGGTYLMAPLGGGKVPGAVVDGAWMHPALLERMVKEGYGDLQVLTGPYPLGGTTYDAVSVVSNGTGGYQSWTWDRATGLLLVASSRQDGAFSPFSAPGETAPQANSFLGYRQLAGVRQRTLPGAGTPLPDWLDRTDQLSYAGTYTFVNPMDPSSQPMTFGYTTDASFTKGGPTWATVKFKNVIDFTGNPSPGEGTGIATGTGTWWYDPASLAAMQRGQVLDKDPLSGATVTVEDVLPWQNGQSVILRTDLPGNRVRSQYDVATGVLLGTEIWQQAQGTTISIGLQRLP